MQKLIAHLTMLQEQCEHTNSVEISVPKDCQCLVAVHCQAMRYIIIKAKIIIINCLKLVNAHSLPKLVYLNGDVFHAIFPDSEMANIFKMVRW